MDPITHGMLGGVTAQLGFRQRIGRETTWVAAAAAVLPDLDIFAGLFAPSVRNGGHLAMVPVHRGLSHSLLMVPVIALSVSLIWWWFRRRAARTGRASPSFWLLYSCSFVAVLSHSLLDWCTSYGTQLLAPISRARFALDAVPIVDIIYSPILILTLVACCVARKRKTDARKLTLLIGWLGFSLSVGYICAGYTLRGAAIRHARRSIGEAAGGTYAGYPRLGTIFLWRVTRETPDKWTVFRVRPLRGAGEIRWNEAPVVDNEWVRRAREQPKARTYDWFAMGQTRATYELRDGRHVVGLHDMRYGALTTESLESMWPLVVTFDASGRLLGVRSVRRTGGKRRWQAAREAWRDIWGP